MNRISDLRASRTTGRIAGRVSGRALLIVTAALTVLATAGVLLNDLVRTIYLHEGAYDLKVLLLSPSGLPASLDGDTDQTTSYLWSALISSHEALVTPRLLQSLAIGLASLTFLAAAITILLLCRRLWTGRAFTASTAVALLVVAGLALVTAWFAPSLRHRADEVALSELGYRTSGTGRWVELPYSEVDASLLILGVVLALAGLVFLAAKRLQSDSEGLV